MDARRRRAGAGGEQVSEDDQQNCTLAFTHSFKAWLCCSLDAAIQKAQRPGRQSGSASAPRSTASLEYTRKARIVSCIVPSNKSGGAEPRSNRRISLNFPRKISNRPKAF
jgi:hypothetical protein